MRKIKSRKRLKIIVALLMMVCMICPSTGGNGYPAEVVRAANAKSYTVELNGTTDLFLSNKTASSGTVTLSYKVESVTMALAKNGNNNGVVATTSPGAQYPYTSGSMKYHHLGNYVLLEGCTYTFTMNLDSAGKVACTTATYTDANGATKNVSIPLTAGNGETASQYFGIYVHPSTTAKLTNVTCTDVEGNDLGLQVNTNNTAKCTIAESAAEPLTSYTVELNGTTDLFLSNKTASSGPVTLKYTVESVTMATSGSGDNNGVVATTTPGAQYPYTSGSMKYHHLGNFVLLEGCTYTFTMSLDSAGKVTCATAAYTDANGTKKNTNIPLTTGNGATASQYFGIYVSRQTTAKLTNVTCTDAEGNNLGLQVNTKNTAKCTVEEKEREDGSYTRLSFRDYRRYDDGLMLDKAVNYTVTIEEATNVFLSNETACSGPVTISYTVESATVAMANKGSDNNGVIATTAPATTYPYTAGSMKYHNNDNQMFVAGRTYAITMQLDVNGKITCEGSWTNATTGTSGTVSLPLSAGNGATASQYFGIYVNPKITAKLMNVTCTDAEGNNLGLQGNNANCTIRKTAAEAESLRVGKSLLAYTGSVGNLDHVKFAGILTFTETGLRAQEVRIGGNYDSENKMYYGIALYLHNNNLYAYNYYTSEAESLGTGFSVNEEIPVSIAFTKEKSSWKAAYYVNNAYVKTVSYSQTDNFGKYMYIAKGVTVAIAGKFNAVEEQKPVSYDLADGSYLVAGDCVVTDADGNAVTMDGDDPVLTMPGDYELLTTAGSFRYRKKVSLYKIGDMNLDGTAGQSTDLTKLQELLNGMTDAYEPDCAAEYAADLDNDGKVGKKDLELMQDIISADTDTTLADVVKKYHVAALTYDYLGGNEVMPIVGYYGPYSRNALNYLTDDIYQSVKDCGINLINYSFNGLGEGNSASALKALELSEKYGIGYYVEDFRLNPEYDTANQKAVTTDASLTMAEVADWIGEYSYFESYLGHHVADEPFPCQIYAKPTRELEYFDWTAETLNRYVNAGGFINVCGTSATGTTKIYPGTTTGTTYSGFLQRIADLGAQVLSFDSYPFASESKTLENQQNYFTSLWQIRNVAQENDIPFWSYVQAGGDFTTEKRATKEDAIPTEEETYWNVNTSLAFGAKGIEWFTLIQAPSLAYVEDGDYDCDRNGLVAVDGSKTPFYAYAQKINSHIAAIDEVLMKAESAGIMATGTTTESVLTGSGVTLLDNTDKLRSVTAENATYGALVGCFDYRDTEAFYVMNYDTAASQNDTITLTFDKAYDVRLIQDGVTTFTSGSSVTLMIPSGEAVLVVLEDRVVEVSDISSYRGATYSVPDAEPGYIFAGWYQDADCTEPISTEITTGKAYAKFVDEAVLTVKAQITAGTTKDSTTSDIRFVTTSDTLNYSKIGFEVTANSVTKTYGSAIVYKQLYAVDSNNVLTEYTPEKEFSAVSTYFKACTIKNVLNKSFGVEWTVRPYWITCDGTTVYGETAVKSVEMGIGR